MRLLAFKKKNRTGRGLGQGSEIHFTLDMRNRPFGVLRGWPYPPPLQLDKIGLQLDLLTVQQRQQAAD